MGNDKIIKNLALVLNMVDSLFSVIQFLSTVLMMAVLLSAFLEIKNFPANKSNTNNQDKEKSKYVNTYSPFGLPVLAIFATDSSLILLSTPLSFLLNLQP